MAVYLIKRERKWYIYLLMEVHNAISKTGVIKIKPEFDKKKKCGPTYRKYRVRLPCQTIPAKSRSWCTTGQMTCFCQQKKLQRKRLKRDGGIKRDLTSFSIRGNVWDSNSNSK